MTSKNNNGNNHSTEEVKRFIGAVTEDFTEKVEAIGEQFSTLNRKIDKNTEKIDRIAEKITKNTKKIVRNAEKIDKNTEMIAKVAEDVTDIKEGLRNKVDYEEFESLKKRVVELEQNVTK